VYQPKLLPADWTVTELLPGRGFTWVSQMPGVRVIGRHVIEPIQQGSRVTLSIEFEGLFAGLADRVFRKLNERYVGMEANGLKRRCEE